MKLYKYPPKHTWDTLSKRTGSINKELDPVIRKIMSTVRADGDSALIKFTEDFDSALLTELKVSKKEKYDAELRINYKLRKAIDLAYDNIHKFHLSQLEKNNIIETSEGVKCWRKSVPIKKVGMYIPGGTAALFSTVLMLGIPSQIAGCEEKILCTPPGKDGNISDAILYSAKKTGITNIFKCGGAQAIAAMAYGTESIPRVDKIFGPGNNYVTRAKELALADGISIDMPAGPSEVLIIADNSSVPDFIAADLLSQAEHGPDSQVILLSTEERMIKLSMTALKKQLKVLPRQNIATKALAESRAILLKSMDDCLEFSNYYAPEHLIIAVEKPIKLAEKVKSAGSVFLGNYSCESAGDYASGTNHTLPTNGFATAWSGVSVDSFVKKITFQQLSARGLATIGPSIEIMAEAEDLIAHRNAVSIRLKTINNV